MVNDNAAFRRKFSHNLGVALDQAGFKASGFGRVKEVSLRFGVSTTSAQKWLTASSLPEMPKLPEICEELRCSLDDLFFGFDRTQGAAPPPSADPMSTIRVLTNTDERAAYVSKEMFATFWWRTGLSALQVDDAMMEPFVVAGEYVFFEKITSAEHLSGVYVLFHNGRYRVRRLQETMNQSVRLICENKRFTPEDVPIDRIRVDVPELALVEANFVTVIGRVVGRMLMR